MSNKITVSKRTATITALLASGMTHRQIAKELNISTKTVQRHAEHVRPGIDEAESRLNVLQKEITNVISVKERAAQYANLAIKAKNEAVSLGALQRIDDLDGIVTEKERIRAKQSEQPANQPMFMLPPGAMVNVTINQQNNTIGSGLQNQSDAVNLADRASDADSGTSK